MADDSAAQEESGRSSPTTESPRTDGVPTSPRRKVPPLLERKNTFPEDFEQEDLTGDDDSFDESYDETANDVSEAGGQFERKSFSTMNLLAAGNRPTSARSNKKTGLEDMFAGDAELALDDVDEKKEEQESKPTIYSEIAKAHSTTEVSGDGEIVQEAALPATSVSGRSLSSSSSGDLSLSKRSMQKWGEVDQIMRLVPDGLDRKCVLKISSLLSDNDYMLARTVLTSVF